MHRNVRITAGALAVGITSLALVGSASAAVVPVTALTGPWSTQGDAAMTDYGIHFNTSNWSSGSVSYNGFASTLSDIDRLTYTARYNSDAKSGQGNDAPYLRIFFKNGKDAIYDPSVNGDLSENVDHTRDATSGLWRYDDDCGDGILDSTEDNGCGSNTWPPSGTPGYGIKGASFSTLVADHGTEQIDHISVSAGDQFDSSVEAVMTRMRINGDEFNFAATGPQGPAGQDGTNGTDGTNGITTVVGADGANGSDGSNGTVGSSGQLGNTGSAGVTTISRQNGSKTSGATVRTLHAPSIKGMKFVSAKASLHGKRLPVSGREITVDLRSKSVGHYDVSIVATYKKGGKLHVVTITRNLNVKLAA